MCVCVCVCVQGVFLGFTSRRKCVFSLALSFVFTLSTCLLLNILFSFVPFYKKIQEMGSVTIRCTLWLIFTLLKKARNKSFDFLVLDSSHCYDC